VSRAVRPLGSGVALVLALAAGACASVEPVCRSGERRAVTESLYFGTARPGGVVSAEEWRDFVKQVATPRFPSGLTSWPASGQWRGASGVIEREASYVLQIIHPDAGADERAVEEIVREYRRRFEQEAVLRVRSTACVSL
jgi:uncharacterized protein DUF3574